MMRFKSPFGDGITQPMNDRRNFWDHFNFNGTNAPANPVPAKTAPTLTSPIAQVNPLQQMVDGYTGQSASTGQQVMKPNPIPDASQGQLMATQPQMQSGGTGIINSALNKPLPIGSAQGPANSPLDAVHSNNLHLGAYS